MKAGDAIVIALPDASVDSHCWIVISDPIKDADHIVIVNFTSWRSDKEQACVVEPHEHRYLSKKSCVNYAESKVVQDAQLEALIASGKVRRLETLSDALLERVRAGVADSWMCDDHAQILIDQGFVDL